MGHRGTPAFAMQYRHIFYIFMVFCMGKFATLQVNPVCNPIGNLWGECGVYSIYLTPETLSYCIGTQAICQVKKLTIIIA